MIAARKQAKPETAAPMKTPQIMPTAKAYLTIPASALWPNRLETNSGETVATSAPNAHPRKAESSAPTSTTTKKPTAVLMTFSAFITHVPFMANACVQAHG